MHYSSFNHLQMLVSFQVSTSHFHSDLQWCSSNVEILLSFDRISEDHTYIACWLSYVSWRKSRLKCWCTCFIPKEITLEKLMASVHLWGGYYVAFFFNRFSCFCYPSMTAQNLSERCVIFTPKRRFFYITIPCLKAFGMVITSKVAENSWCSFTSSLLLVIVYSCLII